MWMGDKRREEETRKGKISGKGDQREGKKMVEGWDLMRKK